MPEPPLESSKLPCVGALLAAVVALPFGCRDAPADEPSNGYVAERNETRGTRIVFEDGAGEAMAKLRERPSTWKVYDAQFLPVGEVRRPPDVSARDGRSETASPLPEIRVFRYDDTVRATFGRRRTGVWGLADRVRVERTGRGWAVFDGDANWVGRFERRSESGWRLVRGQSRESAAVVSKQNGYRTVTYRDEVVVRGPVRTAPPNVLLAMAIEELSILDRVAVGTWLGESHEFSDAETSGANG